MLRSGTVNTIRELAIQGKPVRAIARELGELSKVTAAGSNEIMAVHARMEAAEKALPGYAQFTARRTALRGEIDRAEQDVRQARARTARRLMKQHRIEIRNGGPLSLVDDSAGTV